MAAAKFRVPRIAGKQTFLSALGGVALIAAAVAIRTNLDTTGPAPAVAAPAAREPLYVLPPQPADLVGATVIAAPAPDIPAWQRTQLTARHPEP